MSTIIENGIEAGTWNKYQSHNPVQRWLVRRFLGALSELARTCAHDSPSAIDIGCGEGVSTALLKSAGLKTIRGYDFSAQIVEVARSANPGIPFDAVSIYELGEPHRSDFVSACEVLEHLEKPMLGLERMAAVCQRHCLLSVPNDPLFRSLNFCAGKYWHRWGNSPGHINHWNSREFVELVQKYFDIEQVRSPLPWTIVLAKPRA